MPGVGKPEKTKMPVDGKQEETKMPVVGKQEKTSMPDTGKPEKLRISHTAKRKDASFHIKRHKTKKIMNSSRCFQTKRKITNLTGIILLNWQEKDIMV
ncbi:MAG: hypothetical protein ACOCUR_02120, partial [Nanoarchaeota archaeon]